MRGRTIRADDAAPLARGGFHYSGPVAAALVTAPPLADMLRAGEAAIVDVPPFGLAR